MSFYQEEEYYRDSPPGLDFDTPEEALTFNDWLSETRGVRMQVMNQGCSLVVPFGVGCAQETLNDWFDLWEQLNG